MTLSGDIALNRWMSRDREERREKSEKQEEKEKGKRGYDELLLQ